MRRIFFIITLLYFSLAYSQNNEQAVQLKNKTQKELKEEYNAVLQKSNKYFTFLYYSSKSSFWKDSINDVVNELNDISSRIDDKEIKYHFEFFKIKAAIDTLQNRVNDSLFDSFNALEETLLKENVKEPLLNIYFYRNLYAYRIGDVDIVKEAHRRSLIVAEENDTLLKKVFLDFGNEARVINEEHRVLLHTNSENAHQLYLRDSTLFSIRDKFQLFSNLVSFNKPDTLCLSYLNTALASPIKDPLKKIPLLLDKAYISNQLNQFHSADQAYLKAIDIANTYNIGDHFLASIYVYYTFFLHEINRNEEALMYFAKFEELLTEEQRMNILQQLEGTRGARYNNILTTIYTLKKEYKTALQYQTQYVYSLENKIYEFNETELLKYSEEFNSARKDQEILRQNLELEKEKGRRNTYIFSAFFILLLLIIIFTYRITKLRDKKRYSEKLLAQQNELNIQRKRFIENIAHEIKTPLTIINGTLDKFAKNQKLSKKEKETLLDITKSITQIDTEINYIVQSIGSNNINYQRNQNTVNLQQFIDKTIHAFEPVTIQHGITLLQKGNLSNDTYIELDREKVQKIVFNFITNAIKYSETADTITITTEIDDQTNLNIKVTDNGIGISPKDQERIFERFYQSNSNNHVGGFGIGLSLSKELAEFLNGSIQLTSIPNKETSFILTIPVNISEQSEQEAELVLNTTHEHVPVELLTSTSLKTILIVDDNVNIIDFYKSMLSKHFNCIAAYNGQEALKLAKEHQFDLVISDIMMPKIDGFTFRRLLKEMPQYTYVPFIFVSAKSQIEDKIDALKLGVDDYITKPFHSDELLARVNNTIRTYQAKEEWLKENTENDTEVTQKEHPIIEQAVTIIKHNLTNEDFGVKELASALNYSTKQLGRIFVKNTGLTPVKFILDQRLKFAYITLKQDPHIRVNEIQAQVGISNPSYFHRKFKERFGVSPRELTNT